MASFNGPGPSGGTSTGTGSRKAWSMKSKLSKSRSVYFGTGGPAPRVANPVGDDDDPEDGDDGDDGDDGEEGEEDDDDALDGLMEYHLTRIPSLSLAMSDSERARAFGDNQRPPAIEAGAAAAVDVVEVTVTVVPPDDLAGFGDASDGELPEESEVASSLEVVMSMSAANGCDRHRRAKLGTPARFLHRDHTWPLLLGGATITWHDHWLIRLLLSLV